MIPVVAMNKIQDNYWVRKMSDVELTNYFVNRAVPNTRALTEEERLYREEILERMACRKWEEVEMNCLRQEAVKEFKDKLINEIKSKREHPTQSQNIIDLINNFE